jgi:hypothetical protein
MPSTPGAIGRAIARLRAAETQCLPGGTALTEAAARALFELMAY